MKRVARVLIKIIPLILLISLSLTSCVHYFSTPTGKYVWGDIENVTQQPSHGCINFTPDTYVIFATSDTDTFPKDDVTFDLSYGLYKYSPDISGNFPASGVYLNKDVDSRDDIFARSFEEPSEYSIIDPMITIQAFDPNKPFTEEYTYEVKTSWPIDIFRKVKCNHTESITVPEEYFDSESGSFEVILVFYKQLQGPEADRTYYRVNYYRTLIFNYEKLPDGMIKINYRNSLAESL